MDVNKVLIDAISAEIKVRNPKATSIELTDTSKKVVDIFETINGGIMQLEDVTKEVIDFCLKMSEKTNSFKESKNMFVQAMDEIVNSVEKFRSGIIDFQAKTLNIDSIAEKVVTSKQKSFNMSLDRFANGLMDIVKRSISMTKNFVSSMLSNIHNFFSNIVSSITSPFKKIAAFITAPFKQLAEFIKSPFKSIVNIKNKIASKSGAAIDMVAGGMVSGPGKRSRDEDYNIAGVTSRGLSESLVLRRTAAGVAVYWLYKQLHKSGMLGSGGIAKPGSILSDIITGNMVSKIVGWLLPIATTFLMQTALPFILSFLPLVIPAIVGYGIYKYFTDPNAHAGTPAGGYTGASDKGLAADVKGIVDKYKENKAKENKEMKPTEKSWKDWLKPFTATAAEASEIAKKKTADNYSNISTASDSLSDSLKTNSLSAIKATDSMTVFNKQMTKTSEEVIPNFWESITSFIANLFKPDGSGKGRGGSQEAPGKNGGKPEAPKTLGSGGESRKTSSPAKSYSSGNFEYAFDVNKYKESLKKSGGKNIDLRAQTAQNVWDSIMRMKEKYPDIDPEKIFNQARHETGNFASIPGAYNYWGTGKSGKKDLKMHQRNDTSQYRDAKLKTNRNAANFKSLDDSIEWRIKRENMMTHPLGKSAQTMTDMEYAQMFKNSKYYEDSVSNYGKALERLNKSDYITKKPMAPSAPGLDVASKTKEETTRSRVAEQNVVNNKMLAAIETLNKTSVAQLENEKNRSKSPSVAESTAETKVASNPLEVPKLIMQMVFGMSAGGENNNFGII